MVSTATSPATSPTLSPTISFKITLEKVNDEEHDSIIAMRKFYIEGFMDRISGYECWFRDQKDFSKCMKLLKN